MDDAEITTHLVGRDALLQDAAVRGRAYLRSVASRSVQPDPRAVDALGRFHEPISDEGLPAEEILALLDDVGSGGTMATAGPRFFGFVNGGALPIAVAASWLLSAWDQNVALELMSPVGARLDAASLALVVELLGLPAGTGGGFVTGATMANATCLAAARDSVLEAAGWDALSDGLVGAPPVQVVAGAEAHTTIDKALGLVGLGRGRTVRLPADDQGRIVTKDLPALASPTIVCLQAGNVNTGASDPFPELVSWAKSQGAWVHVDGAFGLWAAACPEVAHEVDGIGGADSWATDAHKWLNTTYDCGIALVADPKALATAMQATAAYLPLGGGRDPMAFTPQSSQRARGAEVWAVLTSLGRQGLAGLVAASCAHARRFGTSLAANGIDVLNEVHLNQVLVDFGGPERNAEVMSAVRTDGTCWCGPTTWHGRSAMRISVSCWATTTSDVDRSVEAMLRAAGAA